nr:MAG TPA: hypothetical protein [Caudoviricetes sp.]
MSLDGGRGSRLNDPPPSSSRPPYFPRRDIWKANWGLGSRAHRKFLCAPFFLLVSLTSGPRI